MGKGVFVTGIIELMAFGMLFGALGAWSVALAPIR
ncbi:hypothetical protein QO016_004665 [Methylobacterium persicinum]|uniref:Uncharacterized protein n=1 Tax=Methylobacterium persicinum TaxID=374426 RepID=A0ABU0HTI6_9HYPH|nr:hypothetical protein [Methylobacterium persicinum]GJE38697.1 hypothetical protein KHHGKMAE_2772 [Methylobacterium persicinum]